MWVDCQWREFDSQFEQEIFNAIEDKIGHVLPDTAVSLLSEIRAKMDMASDKQNNQLEVQNSMTDNLPSIESIENSKDLVSFTIKNTIQLLVFRHRS